VLSDLSRLRLATFVIFAAVTTLVLAPSSSEPFRALSVPLSVLAVAIGLAKTTTA